MVKARLANGVEVGKKSHFCQAGVPSDVWGPGWGIGKLSDRKWQLELSVRLLFLHLESGKQGIFLNFNTTYFHRNKRMKILFETLINQHICQNIIEAGWP